MPQNRKGRPKGCRNKRTREFNATLEENNFNPAQALIDIHADARLQFKMSLEDGSPAAVGYLKIASDTAKEIAHYTYPKLKAVELPKNNELEAMSPAERLEAMKKAVKFLEDQMQGKLIEHKLNEPIDAVCVVSKSIIDKPS